MQPKQNVIAQHYSVQLSCLNGSLVEKRLLAKMLMSDFYETKCFLLLLCHHLFCSYALDSGSNKFNTLSNFSLYGTEKLLDVLI